MKQVKYLLRGKRSTVHVDRHMGRLRERESHWVAPSWQFDLLFWGISSRSLWLIISICLVHSPYLVYFRILLYVHTLSLSQDRVYQKGLWVEHHFSLNSKEPFCTCVVREVSWLWEWEICGLGRAWPPLLTVLLNLEFQTIRDESPIAFPGEWIYLLPHH